MCCASSHLPWVIRHQCWAYRSNETSSPCVCMMFVWFRNTVNEVSRGRTSVCPAALHCRASDFFTTTQFIPEFGFCPPPPPPSPPPQRKDKRCRGTRESSDTWASSPGRKAKTVSARDGKLRKIFVQQEEKQLFNCPCHGRRLYLIVFLLWLTGYIHLHLN